MQPFAFDFGTLQHGWVRFTKGQRAEWDLAPASRPLDTDRHDWVPAATCHHRVCGTGWTGAARMHQPRPSSVHRGFA